MQDVLQVKVHTFGYDSSSNSKLEILYARILCPALICKRLICKFCAAGAAGLGWPLSPTLLNSLLQ